MGIQITPSILNADFASLGDEVARIGSADWVHVDVMDDHFVPNLTFGPAMVEALARRTSVPLDAHLMIADPDRRALDYVDAGCGSTVPDTRTARASARPSAATMGASPAAYTSDNSRASTPFSTLTKSSNKSRVRL